MNYIQGLIGAGGLGAVAIALVNRTNPLPPTTLGFILLGMGVLALAVVALQAYVQPGRRLPEQARPDAARAAEPVRSLVYLAFSKGHPALSADAHALGAVFDACATPPSRRQLRDNLKQAKAVVAVIEPGPRRDCALIELGHALPDKDLYLLIARHESEPELPIIAPLRRRATYLIFESDRDLRDKLRQYWAYVQAGNLSQDP